MTDHPITPPPELVQQWIAEIWHEGTPVQVAQSDLHLATRAFSEGYEHRGEVNEAKLQQARDQELEACCELLKQKGVPAWSLLRTARRPKPPSLKEQALHVLGSPIMIGESRLIGHRDHDLLRRALEALPDD